MGARRQDPTLALLPLDPEPSHGPEGRYSSAILYTREPGGEVGIALQFIVKGPIPERWGCPIPEPPSLGVQPGLQGTDGLGRGRGEMYKS